ncbi:MAG: hypothetical protein R3291_05835 [Thermoplasmata archaeon]|nr:hypothetical protein [Thermoplasmata archaeon]
MARRGDPRTRPCSVAGCTNEVARSLSYRKVRDALAEHGLEEGRRAYLCKPHYKEYKKATKGERTIDRLTW